MKLSKMFRSLLIITILALTACSENSIDQASPTDKPEVIEDINLTDEEFSPLAGEVCQQLSLEIDEIVSSTSLSDLGERFEQLSSTYRKAHDALVNLPVEVDTAPQATIFIESLDKMTLWQETFSSIYTEAMTKSLEKEGLELGDISAVFFLEDGRIMCASSSKDALFSLDIDNSIMLEYSTIRSALSDAANTLELENCFP